MANELNIILPDKGLTITCHRYLNGVEVSPAINMSEIGTNTGIYTGNMTGAPGNYILAFRSAGENVGAGNILWDGSQEITLAPIKTKTDALNTDRLAVCSTVDITASQIASIT